MLFENEKVIHLGIEVSPQERSPFRFPHAFAKVESDECSFGNRRSRHDAPSFPGKLLQLKRYQSRPLRKSESTRVHRAAAEAVALKDRQIRGRRRQRLASICQAHWMNDSESANQNNKSILETKTHLSGVQGRGSRGRWNSHPRIRRARTRLRLRLRSPRQLGTKKIILNTMAVIMITK